MKSYHCFDNISYCKYSNLQMPYNIGYREALFEDTDMSPEYDVGIYERNVTEILNLIEYIYSNLYAELMSYGMSRGGVRYLFRYIVYFTISNADKYMGNETEKAYAIFNALRRDEPWVLSSFSSSYIPQNNIAYIITTIIMFTLENISGPVEP